MKKVIFFIAATAFFANAEAQYTINKNVSDFNAVKVSAATHVYLVQSDSNYVSISSKDSTGKMPKMDIRDNTLEINSSFGGRMTIHVKNIKSIKVNEAARVTCKDTLHADNLTVLVSDAGRADILVHAKNLHVKGADASYITLAGTADTLQTKATDASHIVADKLKALAVQVRSADGSEADVWAVNSIDAVATDGSSIHVQGMPAQKNTSASDGGSVTMDATQEEITPENNNQNMPDSGKGPRRHKIKLVVNDAFIGGGFVTGPAGSGDAYSGSNPFPTRTFDAHVKYGASREFIVGFGWERKLVKWNGIGVDIYYKSTGFYFNEDSAKKFPTKVQHEQEKLSFQNFGGLVYDRFHFGKNIYLDGGFYLDWTFHSKYITWDGSTPNASSTKTIQRNFSYINPDNYGLTFRVGSTKGLSVYFNYRLSNLFKPIDYSTGGVATPLYMYYPELPAYTVGITIGGF